MEKLTREQKQERNEKVISAYEAGKTVEAISEELGISKKVTIGILIYNKVYKAPEKPKKVKRPSKKDLLQKAEIPNELLAIDGVRNLPTDTILTLAELMDGSDRQEWKGIIKRKTA